MWIHSHKLQIVFCNKFKVATDIIFKAVVFRFLIPLFYIDCLFVVYPCEILAASKITQRNLDANILPG